MKNLVYIPVAEISPHPDNPRKDLGDLEELIDSIKANGILQNLTVIRGHRLTAAELDEAKEDLAFARERNSPLAEELEEIIDSGMSDDGYTAIIGHRRLAAAKAAGLREVLCAVVEMTPQEQIATMLAENVMREELTPYEQAQGFQLMLDMGETVSTIAEKTRFSKSTVQRRVKLLELDPAKFKASEERGAQLKDYAELDKIKDPGLRNEVLADIATPNFQNSLKRAMEVEKDRKFVANRAEEISQWAEEISNGYDREMWRYYTTYNRWNWKKDSKVERPEDTDTVKYAFIRSKSDVTVYRQNIETENVETPEDRARREEKEVEERKGKELEAISKRHLELREAFIRDFRVKGQHTDIISQFACYSMANRIGYYGMHATLAVNLLGGETDINNAKETLLEILGNTAEPPLYCLLACAYANCENDGNKYFDDHWDAEAKMFRWDYKSCDNLDVLYSYLAELGYEMSDEELALQNGTHELFQTGEEGE